jgi:hypothetical protein
VKPTNSVTPQCVQGSGTELSDIWLALLTLHSEGLGLRYRPIGLDIVTGLC